MKNENESEEKKDEGLKTFDMYRCFSRVDVILAILLVLGLLIFTVFYIFMPQPV